ncbi:MAG TPA: hypothetical protein VH596_14710 [Terriglobales bacterium]|jgi:hypothetical protein
MASHPRSDPVPQQLVHAGPYCNDPDCEYCSELREVQDSIRLHETPSTNIPKDEQ